LQRIIKDSSSQNALNLVYLDKNLPPMDILNQIEYLNEHAANDNAEIVKVAMVPKISSQYENYPFSLNFFV
jgi:hypothetical protein